MWRRHFPPEYHLPVAAALLKAPDTIAEWYVRPRLVAQHVEHMSGPPHVGETSAGVIGLSVVRNAADHIDAFVQHHLRLGLRHLVILDNGSTDDTVERAGRYDRVTVLRTALPYRRYEVVLKRYLVRRFASGGWYLFVDADERFEYPLADRISLRSLTGYLDARGYRAMIAQMLDLFPDGRLADLNTSDHFERTHTWYDLSGVVASPYIWGADPSSPVRMHWGGIRSQLFGTKNGLTKVALARGDQDIEPFVGWHHMRNARVANVSGALRHYPFAGRFADRVREAVARRRYGRSAAHEYRKYWQVLQSNPQRQLRSATSAVWTGLEPLIAHGFIVVPESYRQWASPELEAASPRRGSAL